MKRKRRNDKRNRQRDGQRLEFFSLYIYTCLLAIKSKKIINEKEGEGAITPFIIFLSEQEEEGEGERNEGR